MTDTVTSKNENLGFCQKCGHKLISRFLENEGNIPYCENCGEFRFPMFNVAISAIVHDPSGEKIALIQQYGRTDNILVAGYLSLGESAEQALIREVKEELGLDVVKYHFNASEYFKPSNTLMVNFACQVSSDELTHCNEEIDHIEWYSKEEAREAIKPESLARKFLLHWLDHRPMTR